jgi:hypothetical protein
MRLRLFVLVLISLVAACADSAPVPRLPSTLAAKDSPANGTWAGELHCDSLGTAPVKVAIDEVDIEDGRVQAFRPAYLFQGRFDRNGAGHLVGRLRRGSGTEIPFELAMDLQGAKIVGSGRYEFLGALPGARDGPVLRHGSCSGELDRIDRPEIR